MNQSYLSARFEQIDERFREIDLLLSLADKNQNDTSIYNALCRSAHVLLVGHFEGLYKEICKDIIDDINSNTSFFEIPKHIFNTHCDFFLQKKDDLESANIVRKKLIEAFKDHQSKVRIEPFLFVDNKNPTPQIIETILKRFGIRDFFWSLDGSDLDTLFEGLKRETFVLRRKIYRYVRHTTLYYPYAADKSIYGPIKKENQKKVKTLWEDFIDDFLKDRHSIIHGNITGAPLGHQEISEAKIKIEILVYVYIINLCAASNPIIFL